MGSQISINVHYGNSSVQQDDIERAEKAALEVLAGHDVDKVFAEFQRQWLEFDDYSKLTGDALLWVEAEKAADVALTLGWHNTEGASCGISA